MAPRRNQQENSDDEEEDTRGLTNDQREAGRELFKIADKPDQCPSFKLSQCLDRCFDINDSTLNFARAGMIIFGAARIFGRKVDYLMQEAYGMNDGLKVFDIYKI